jgi:hypothetical protein
LHIENLDTLDYSMKAYEANFRELSFRAKSKAEARRWQRRLRAELVELLGGFPEERVPLRARTVEAKDLGSYTRETVLFKSRANMAVYGYYLLPKPKPQTPIPAVICFPGHGRGVDDIVGIQEDGSLRDGYGGYQNDFALQCVHRGYATLAVEQFGFGHRRDERARDAGPGNTSCQPSSGAALLLGQTMIGWRVYDGIRAIDYLETRGEVDANRIADMGISGGGTTAFYLSAVDVRVAVSIISGYFNTYRDSIMSVSHCIDNYIPGILRYAEMYDIAGLIAPRPLFAESGDEDGIFPHEATEYAVERARSIYEILGHPERIGLQVFKGKHSFHGQGAFEFLERWL